MQIYQTGHLLNRKQRGYTLIEVLVTVTVMALVSGAMVSAGVRSNDRLKIRRAVQDLAALLDSEQRHARFSGAVQTIELIGNQLYKSGEDIFEIPATIDVSAKAEDQVSRVQRIEFYPDGSVNAPVIIVSANSVLKEIRIGALSGQVQVTTDAQ
ncbi:MAG: Tfp pilus assembly protein FimT/FimU [Sphingomonadales bacterium]